VQAKSRDRGSLKKGSIHRAKKRGLGVGYGNLGKYGSKPALSKWKRTGAKTSKKINLVLTCQECKKSQIKSGSRVKKIELK
jgi:ribosomal protein L44E